MSDAYETLNVLLRSGHPCVTISTQEEAHALEMVKAALHSRVDEVWQWSAASGLRRAELTENRPIEETMNPAAAMTYVRERPGRTALIALDMLAHMGEPTVVRAAKDLIHDYEAGSVTPAGVGASGPGGAPVGMVSGHLVLIDHGGELPTSLAASAATFDVPLPDAEELETILRRTLSRYHREVAPIDVGITKGQLAALIGNLQGLTRKQAERVVIETVSTDQRFDPSDIGVVLDAKRRLFSGSGALDFVDKPTDLSSIGGMRNLKEWLDQRKRAFAEGAARFGLSAPRGVLMLGVQGTGKSLCAKAIATAWDRPLLRMDAGALYNQYIGESERRLRSALKQAEAMAPVILWIDEIEKAFASASNTSNDGGLSRRMFGTLLTWMQEHTSHVFLVATANDIDALPPELLRKGRFDDIFFVDLPRADVRQQIYEIHLRKRERDPESFDLEALAAASDGFSAAEIEQSIVSALHSAYSETHRGGAGELTTEMILEAVRSSPPLSVTAAEKIASLQRWAQGRCVPAD
jgi:hypothetical protein